MTRNDIQQFKVIRKLSGDVAALLWLSRKNFPDSVLNKYNNLNPVTRHTVKEIPELVQNHVWGELAISLVCSQIIQQAEE